MNKMNAIYASETDLEVIVIERLIKSKGVDTIVQ